LQKEDLPGIWSKATISQILKNQKTHLEAFDYYSKKS
jgi:hypothetical protein